MTDLVADPERHRAIESLERGIDAELGLLAELSQGLAEQRQAIAADDTAKLDQLGQQLGRTLWTLREARRQRGVLLALVVGQPDAKISDVVETLAPPAAAAIRLRTGRLRQAAQAASRELTINQAVIRRSIESGERLLHHLLTSPTTESYGQRESTGREGLLLNQRA